MGQLDDAPVARRESRRTLVAAAALFVGLVR
jgi:hypothetical protein